eukprot:m51a1_g10866 hypothetical protein (273) ;mRNA; f:36823-37871
MTEQLCFWSPRPRDYVASVPASWDWRNVNGTNYATPNTNQHIPLYCGACWAFAATSCLTDRLNILNRAAHRPAPVVLSQQVLLNCAGTCGTCDGGSTLCVYEYAANKGLPDQTCQLYEGKDKPCNDIGICMDCSREAGCKAKTGYDLYFAEEYASITGGADEMRKEIFARGPISCRLELTQAFVESYKGGVFYDADPKFNVGGHYVSVYGWGVDESGVHYWIARNSWGTAWAEDGWFRVITSADSANGDDGNMRIETRCTWGAPSPVPKRSH